MLVVSITNGVKIYYIQGNNTSFLVLVFQNKNQLCFFEKVRYRCIYDLKYGVSFLYNFQYLGELNGLSYILGLKLIANRSFNHPCVVYSA